MHLLTLKILLIATILCLSHATCPAESIESRRRILLEAAQDSAEETSRSEFRVADALFELGRTDQALKAVNSQLDALEPGNKINRWMHGGNTNFIAWPGIDTYMRYHDRMDRATLDRYRRIYTGGVFYKRLTTSNHVIMAAVTRYLATQAWGDSAFKADSFWAEGRDPKYPFKQAASGEPLEGTYFTKDDRSGEKYIRQHLRNVVTQGPGEYASRPYGAQNLLPLLTLAECAKDPEIRHRARMAYEYCIIQLAPAWLGGHLATFSPRSYPDMLTQQPWGVATLPWYYFGGVPPGDPAKSPALRIATAAHRLPDALQEAGTDRTRPYTYRALINSWTLTHYVNRTYALFCRSSKARGRGFSGQSYPCGVMWNEPDVSRASHLWVTNPVADRATGDRSNLTNGIHTHGVSKFEEQLLHENTMLSVYDIDSGFRNPYVLGYIPGGARAVINDSQSTGRIFLHYGNVLIALHASQPFAWDPSQPMLAPAGKPRPGDSEFRIMTTKAAVAIETAHPDEIPAATPQAQLAAFRYKLSAATRITTSSDPHFTANYTDRSGNTLTCSYGGKDFINGQAVDYAKWPVLESPWTRQQQTDSPLIVTEGKQDLTYDFKQWTVQ